MSDNNQISTAHGTIHSSTFAAPSPVYDYTGGITIKKVENGYVVLPNNIQGGGIIEPLAVFNDFYEMCNWIREHFGEEEPVE